MTIEMIKEIGSIVIGGITLIGVTVIIIIILAKINDD